MTPANQILIKIQSIAQQPYITVKPLHSLFGSATDWERYECLSCLNPDLRDGYSTLLSQLLLGLLAGVGVSQVGVEVLV